MVKCLRLANEVFAHIKNSEYDKAIFVCEELLKTLKTFRESC